VSLDARDRLLCAAGLPAWARRRRRRDLTILMYHGVVERPLEVECWHQLPRDAFARQMAWVARRYAVLPLDEALARLATGTLPDRALALTFDDGYRNVRTVAGPVLAAHRMHATVFLVTDLVGTDDVVWADRLYLAFARSAAASVDVPDLGLARCALDGPVRKARAYATSVRALKGLPVAEKDARMAALLAALGRTGPEDPGDFRMLTWDDVDAMRGAGPWGFAGHSTRHEILARMPDGQVASAIGRSHEVVAARTGRVPTVFAYPNGRAMDFDDRARAALAHLGVRFALSTIEGFNDATTDRLALERISVGADLTFARFRLLTSGAVAMLRGRR
jgi:peptidoglycan/xylan/chitin deacetylase (PgdA/CDA1 family)